MEILFKNKIFQSARSKVAIYPDYKVAIYSGNQLKKGQSRQYQASVNYADKKKIQGDFRKVGNDLRVAIGKYEG